MKQSAILKRILKYTHTYLFLIFLSMIFACINVLFTLYSPILIGQAIDCILLEGQVDFALLMPILYRFGIIICITATTQWLMNLCNNRITYRIVKDIRTQAFDKLQKLTISYIDSHPYGDTINRIVSDVELFSDGLLMGFTQLFSGILSIIATLLFMIWIDYRIALLVFCLTPLSLLTSNFIARKTNRMFQKQSQARANVTSHIDEMIGNQKTVQAFGFEETSCEQFAILNDTLQKSSLRSTFFSSLTNPLTRFINALVYAGVGILGAYLAIHGMLSIGQLSSFLSYANQYTKPFNEISGFITEFQNAIICAGRVFELLDQESCKPDEPNAVTITPAEGFVSLENVSFSYRKDSPLIEDLNLSVKPGQRIAIVGPTGCGKSTLINLLMRYYDVDSGSICIDGFPIQNIAIDSLRRNYGMVLQETWLKSGTIHDNICYGFPDASDDEVIRAAKAAHAHSFIMQMPAGYQTFLTEDGGNLSHGQKQLLCIARVMLRIPPMLILDEATSSIDTRTEIKIQGAFARMMKGRTSFVVAHRLSTIQEADLILVMKQGKIIEQGSHNELLAKKGFYAELFYSQFHTA